MRELAKTLVNAGRALPGVNGDMTAAEQFVAQWQQYTGAVAAVHQHTRLYRLGDLVPPRPAPPGHPRIAGRADRDQLTAWFTAFMTEAGALVERDSEQEVDDRIGYGGLTLWETGGAAVSMAGRTRRVAGMIRVGPVYTPPELRRRGYGGAATAAVTQAALDEGVAEVLLFTDLANPTSNALYQHLGYQAVEDRVLLTFSS
jgi:predicted GNAT family acetyltransferase